MNQKEIQKQIDKEYAVFYQSAYDGETPMPSWLIPAFKKAIMSVAPEAHQIHGIRLKQWVSEPDYLFSWSEIGKVVNVVVGVPYNVCFNSLEEAVDCTIELDNFRTYFNNRVAAFDEKMRRKRDSLLNISGSRNLAPKIIRGEA